MAKVAAGPMKDLLREFFSFDLVNLHLVAPAQGSNESGLRVVDLEFPSRGPSALAQTKHDERTWHEGTS